MINFLFSNLNFCTNAIFHLARLFIAELIKIFKLRLNGFFNICNKNKQATIEKKVFNTLPQKENITCCFEKIWYISF